MYRLWVEPDNSVKIEVFTSSDPALRDYTEKTLKADGHVSKDAQKIDFPDRRAIEQVLPATKTDRAKWRYDGEKVVVDPRVVVSR